MKTRSELLSSAKTKKQLINRIDLEDADALTNRPPEDELLYSIEEIAVLVEELM